jgi:hypothetical protein
LALPDYQRLAWLAIIVMFCLGEPAFEAIKLRPVRMHVALIRWRIGNAENSEIDLLAKIAKT